MKAQFKTLAEAKEVGKLVKQVYQQATGKALNYRRMYSNKLKNGYSVKFYNIYDSNLKRLKHELAKHGLGLHLRVMGRITSAQVFKL